MTATDPPLAAAFQLMWPHTFAAIQRLVMAMADCATSFSRSDYDRFDEALSQALMAMKDDSLVAPDSTPSEYRAELVRLLAEFPKAFPNWQDAYAFANECFVDDERAANRKIWMLLGCPGGQEPPR